MKSLVTEKIKKYRFILLYFIPILVVAAYFLVFFYGVGGIDNTPLLVFFITAMLLALYFLAIFIHEMGHIISFRKNGMKIRALFMSAFAIVFDKSAVRLKYIGVSPLLLGGMAVPNIENPETVEDFDDTATIYAASLSSGPVFSVILWCIFLVVITVMFFINFSLAFFTLSPFVFLTALTAVFLFSSNQENDIMVGDFKARSRFLSDKAFKSNIVTFYNLMSTAPVDIFKATYSKELLLSSLDDWNNGGSFSVFHMSNLEFEITKCIIGSVKASGSVADLIEKIASNPNMLSRFFATEGCKTLLYKTAIYESAVCKNIETCKKLYHIGCGLKKTNSDFEQYYKVLVHHAMGEQDGTEYFKNLDKINYSTLANIFSVFPEYHNYERKQVESIIDERTIENGR